MNTGSTTVGSSDLPPFYSQPRASGFFCTLFEEIENELDLPTHRQTTPEEWFETICEPLLKSAAICHKTRCNGASDPTWLYKFTDIPAHARKYAWNKLFMTYAPFKDKADCTGSGMDDEDVLGIPIVVVADLDGVATDEDVATLAAAFTEIAIIKSTGIQLFMRSSGDYETDIRMGFAIATLGEKLCPHLYYDRRCHLRDDGSVGNQRNHPYRLPWGSCKPDGKEKVRSWLPKSGKVASVRDVFNMHNLEMPPLVVRDVDIKEIAEITPKPTPIGSSRNKYVGKGSEGIKHEEYDTIRQTLTDYVVSGMSRLDAENEVIAMKWKYHSTSYLRRTIHKASLKSGEGKTLPAAVWQGIRKDMQHLTCRLGPSSLKRINYQKTPTLQASRAWSFEFLYYQDGINLQEAIEAFFYRKEFEKVRAMSIAAIGEKAVREDLVRLWNKYYHPNLADNPYYGLSPVSRSTVALVYRKAQHLGEFKLAAIRKLLALSKSQTRAALSILCKSGKLIKDGVNSGRVYRVAKIIPSTKKNLSDCIVPAMFGSNRDDNDKSARWSQNTWDSPPILHDFSPPIRKSDRGKRENEPPIPLQI